MFFKTIYMLFDIILSEKKYDYEYENQRTFLIYIYKYKKWIRMSSSTCMYLRF